jgi:hypothetical protein
MANKKGAKENVPVDAAEAPIGSAAGSAPAKARKKGKLIKKKTSRMPRKQKKALQKAAATKG